MKNYKLKIVALVALASVTLAGCSLQYRQRGSYRHSTPYNNGHRPAMHRYPSMY